MGLIRKKADWTYRPSMPTGVITMGRSRVRPDCAILAPGDHRPQRGIEPGRARDFDGFSQLSFDDVQRADRAFGDGSLAAELIADEQHFLGGLHIVTAEPSVVIPLPQAAERARLLKRMSIITRLPSLSEEDFRHEWKVHGDLVRKMPGVGAYRQNVVIAREREKGKPCDYETLPIDGIVELWFEDEITLQQAFASPAGQAAMAHAKAFLGEITAFLVNERQVVGAGSTS
jgi:uncharacterized protein (TIGR02118 family)